MSRIGPDRSRREATIRRRKAGAAPVPALRAGVAYRRRVLSRRRLLVLAGAGLAVAACGRDDRPTLERLRASGVTRVGISGEQPFSYADSTGRITGQAPEVARAVLDGIGAGTLEAVQAPFDDLLDHLLDGRFDLIAAGLTITPDRCDRVAFSRPDFLAPTALLVPRGNPSGLLDFDDVARAQVPVGVLSGSVEQDFAVDAGVPVDLIETYDLQLALVRAVASGAVAAGALTGISLRDALARQPDAALDVTPPITASLDGIPRPPAAGFAFRAADADLRAAFDAGLAELHSSGEWLRISEPFGFGAANEPPPGLTTAEVCNPG